MVGGGLFLFPFYFVIYYVGVFYMCVYLWNICMPGVHRSQNRNKSDSLGLKLEVVDSHHVGAGN